MIKLPRGKARIGDAGRASETRLAKDLGAQLRPASGAMAGVKGDMKLPGTLIEAKSTTNSSISLKHEWLAKISSEARDQSLEPALLISFVNGAGRALPSGNWALIPLREYEAYRKFKDNLE